MGYVRTYVRLFNLGTWYPKVLHCNNNNNSNNNNNNNNKLIFLKCDIDEF